MVGWSMVALSVSESEMRGWRSAARWLVALMRVFGACLALAILALHSSAKASRVGRSDEVLRRAGAQGRGDVLHAPAVGGHLHHGCQVGF